MLCVNNYSKQYIDECRSRIDLQLSTYKKLLETARNKIEKDERVLNAAIESFEPLFFNNLVLLLDALFVHRTRAREKKDGNPLNEVRIMCRSIMENNNRMCADNTIKLNPAKSVLKYKVGDEIKLNEEGFSRLSNSFFSEIENKYL